MEATSRREYRFELAPDGAIVDSGANVELLRKLWLDRSLINGAFLGDGDPGDFDNGAWHIACHLIAAGGVRQLRDRQLLWLEISHDPRRDEYLATVMTKTETGPCTWPIASAEGRELLRDSLLLGFVEGNSLGRISARGVHDPPTRFNLWRRQQFDQPIDSSVDGGKVWEHWCTTRDIRKSSRIGTSVLSAYISLVAALGGLFPAVIARGRRDYHHPKQLAALVLAGFLDEASAVTDLEPLSIPSRIEPLFLQAQPHLSLRAISELDWTSPPRYFMYARRLDRWCPTTAIVEELERLRHSK